MLSQKYKRDEINGSKVIHEFILLHHKWECDSYGWITEDKKLWLTNHGRLYEAEPSELIKNMSKTVKSLKSIMDAYIMASLPGEHVNRTG